MTSQFDLWDLPLWRKAVILCAVMVFFVPGGTLFNKEVGIYTSAPKNPNLTTKQVSPVHVNHGYLRYVTSEEAESLAKWRAIAPALAVVGIAAIAIVMFTHRGSPEAKG